MMTGRCGSLARSLCEASAPHSPPDIEMVYVSVWAAVQMILSEQNIHVENLLGDSMVTFYKKHRFESYEQLEHWIYNMLRALSEVVAESARSKSDDIVAKIISYINQNYSTISNIEDIASHCYISSSHVRRLFKNAMGKTIFEYLLSVRMDKAKTLLTHKNAKIYEIALAVGYESKANFTLAFKKYTGMLPSVSGIRCCRGTAKRKKSRRNDRHMKQRTEDISSKVLTYVLRIVLCSLVVITCFICVFLCLYIKNKHDHENQNALNQYVWQVSNAISDGIERSNNILTWPLISEGLTSMDADTYKRLEFVNNVHAVYHEYFQRGQLSVYYLFRK